MRILVVEDDTDIRGLLEMSLGEAGYAVATAGSASEGMRLAETWAPNLILLDLMLPDRSGVEVCRALRSVPQARAVPIIIVSALSGEQERVAGLEQGADDYVQKPFSMRELLLRIGAVLKRVRSPNPGPRVDSEWAAGREQIRVWEGFLLNHFNRGEFHECREICGTILRRYPDLLTTLETEALEDRIRRCDQRIDGGIMRAAAAHGDANPNERKTW